ncbi:MAG: permease [Candidatus Hodarchaeaceae archaeon]|nr:permease [Candidatus Hodarchaeaceae archaeon]
METKEKIYLSIVIAAVLLYLVTWLLDPTRVKKCVAASFSEVKKLFIPILAAIFAGSVAKNLLLGSRFMKILGGKSKLRGVVAGGTLGSLLPPCPYASYPLIKGVSDGGANSLSTMAMLLGLTSVAVGRVFAGIAILGPEIEGLRILFSFLAVMLVGTLCFYFDRALEVKRRLPRVLSRASEPK